MVGTTESFEKNAFHELCSIERRNELTFFHIYLLLQMIIIRKGGQNIELNTKIQ